MDKAFRLEHVEYLHLLWLIPVFVIIYFWSDHRRINAMKKFGDIKVFGKLLIGYSGARLRIKFMLFLLTIFFLILAIVNPQIGSKLKEVEHKGIDLIIAVDVSRSMDAEDIKPSRLQNAKQAISNLLVQLKGDRVGIVVFAGKSYLHLPMTSDYATAKMYLSLLNTEMIETQGTIMKNAIDLAMTSFPESDHSKALIIISDGEDHGEGAEKKAREAAKRGITIHTIGIGSLEGAPIPLRVKNMRNGFKKDKSGEIVISRLNEELLKNLAAAGNGTYVRTNDAVSGLKKIFDKLNEMEKKKYETKIFSDYNSRFQYFLAFAIFCMLLNFCFSKKKQPNRSLFSNVKKKKMDLNGGVLMILFFLFITFTSSTPLFAQAHKEIRNGNTLYQKGKYSEAETSYFRALQKDSLNMKAIYNRANAQYQQDNFKEAQRAYSHLIENTNDADREAKYLYNLANTYVKENEFEQAIEAYKKSLRLNSSDMDAKHNLAYALQHQQQQQSQDQQQQQGGQDQQQKQGDQDQQQAQGDQDQQQEQGDQDQQQKQGDQSESNRKNNQGKEDAASAKESENITKEDAERILEALRNKEQEVVRKLKKNQDKPRDITIEKDW